MRTKCSELRNVSCAVASHRLRHPLQNRFASSARVVGFLAFTLGVLLDSHSSLAHEDVGTAPATENEPVAASVESVSEAAPDKTESAASTGGDTANDSPGGDTTNDSLLSRVRFALPVEATVIGLTVGVRPEFLFQPFRHARWFELRAAAGVLPGLEYLSTPVSVGIRGRYLDFPVHPLLGIALTQDIYWISDAAPILRGIVETDVGLSIDVAPQWAIDAVAYGGWGAIGEPGPLAGLRLGIRYTPGASSSAP